MRYKIEEWTIEELLEIYKKKLLDLKPPYQRNPIWTAPAQMKLIDTINKKQPIPNFFLLKKSRGKFEMVDGQQRTRTIIGYLKMLITDSKGVYYDEKVGFDNYKLNICIISNLKKDESIEKFYSLVNSSGLRLNRPELMKADYYDTKFLQLITTLAATKAFSDLKLFSDLSAGRMNDIEFVSELVTLLKYGITEKKDKVNQMYDNDINDDEYNHLYDLFLDILSNISRFNDIYALRRTRYKQKNDFYSLFSFLKSTKSLRDSTLNYFYNILVRIGPSISPSNEDCPPLMDYAMNCVTQSNSKKARKARLHFLKLLLLNTKNSPNNMQRDVINYFNMKNSDIVHKQGYLTLKLSKLPKL